MFAENLIQLRKLNHMSQDELADQIGVSRQTISRPVCLRGRASC